MSDVPGSGGAQVLYLEPDDEIPSVIRRLSEVRGTDTAILVAPGRSKATSSAVGLRLIARRAAEAGITVRLVADAGTRLVSADAGLAAYATVAEAQAGDTSPAAEPPPRPRAAIHVVRGERTMLPSMTGPLPVARAQGAAPSRSSAAAATPPSTAHSRADDTQAVPVATPPPPPPRVTRRVRWPSGRRGGLWAVATVLLAVALFAAVLPGATITVRPAAEAVGPFNYLVQMAGMSDSGRLTSTLSAPVTGTYDASTAATGTVTFANYSAGRVTIPAGTAVSAGDQVFTTDVAVSVPGAPGIGKASTADVSVTAQNTGPAGNVAKDAIDTVDSRETRVALCAQFIFCTQRLVANRQPLHGGETKTGPQVSQADVDKLVSQITASLQAELAQHLSAAADRTYAPPSAAESPDVPIPDGLVGRKDQDSLTLTGTLDYDRRYVTQAEVHDAALTNLRDDVRAQPPGRQLAEASLSVGVTHIVAQGDRVAVTLAVRAATVPVLDESQLKARLSGKSREQVLADLADVGSASVDFWPGWVSSVPRLPFRITIRIETPSVTPQPSPTPAPALTPASSGSGAPAPAPSS